MGQCAHKVGCFHPPCLASLRGITLKKQLAMAAFVVHCEAEYDLVHFQVMFENEPQDCLTRYATDFHYMRLLTQLGRVAFFIVSTLIGIQRTPYMITITVDSVKAPVAIFECNVCTVYYGAAAQIFPRVGMGSWEHR